jgi:hypothetical protein
MAHTSTHGSAPDSGSHGHGSHGHGAHAVKLNHEPTDIPLAGTTRAAIVTMVVVGGVMVLMYVAWGFFEWRMRKLDRPAPPLADANYGHRLPPTPRIQSTPTDDLARYRAAQDGKLSSYGWVDRNAGVVRIPIDAAIEILAGRAATIADPKAGETPAAAPAAPAAPATSPTPAPAPAPAAAGH